MRSSLLHQTFFERDVLEVAPDLLGKKLCLGEISLRITEVEAYRGPSDTASHARFGPTKRNEVMWGRGGHAYVYLCYGIHALLNVVTGKCNEPSAVLIRAGEPEQGLELIRLRRASVRRDQDLATGPGRVTSALGVDTTWNGHALFNGGGLELREGPRPERIIVGPRVGIDYAEPDDRRALLRFADADSRCVTHRRDFEQLERAGARRG